MKTFTFSLIKLSSIFEKKKKKKKHVQSQNNTQNAISGQINEVFVERINIKRN